VPDFEGLAIFAEGDGISLLRWGNSGAEALQSHRIKGHRKDLGAAGRWAHQPHPAACIDHARPTQAGPAPELCAGQLKLLANGP